MNIKELFDKAEIIPLCDIMVIPSEKGGFVGFIKEKPEVVSQGETINELKNNLKDALKTITLYESRR